ncbi:DUF429 domain-containing protein [Actinotalea sp. M2MS4P-6]|uniref:DUF429 domain-containing protein n=1 Tax=Actinotalea sp. M2MS4P-6 TaxID=2983762 RepID=UPI0021E4A1D1|nr:DUF429 domain-containing protein [Actinotalea sp. M2MS4P-6]MCV2392691.1 DUF429 domain-containing protein [Actinotalea sp. M2MS4P-6]
MSAFVGIDLAWGPRNRTGVAVCDGTGRLVASETVRTDDQLAMVLDPWLAGAGQDVVVALDAPLVVPNDTGRRDCEAELGRVFARYDAGAHPANRGRTWFDPPRGTELARRFGWEIDPAVRPLGGRAVAIEVYPHPAMVALFGLGRVLPYKQKPGRDLETLRTAWVQLLGHLERVAGPTLRLAESVRWAEIRRTVHTATRKVDLRAIEDEVDAIVCAYLAWLWAHDRDRMDVFGDVERGYIVVPHRDLVAPEGRVPRVGGTVIVLNGTSSAGKSSLLTALQDRWPGPLIDAGLDRHLAMLPRRYLGAAWPEVFGYEWHDGEIARVVPGPVGHRLVRGMHRSAAALAAAGFDVVVDHVLLEPEWASDLTEVLRGTRAVLVGVLCPADPLVQRERERQSRTLGQALAQLPYVHAHGRYDVEVDTSELDVTGARDAVLRWFDAGVEPTALGTWG